MVSYIRNKKFIGILLIVSLWFGIAYLSSFYVFGAGIYSCRDAALIKYGETITPEQEALFIKACRQKQDIGNAIFVIHFLPALVIGYYGTNQLFFRLIPNLDGVRFGGLTFSLGFMPTALLEIFLISLLIYKWRFKQRKR